MSNSIRWIASLSASVVLHAAVLLSLFPLLSMPPLRDAVPRGTNRMAVSIMFAAPERAAPVQAPVQAAPVQAAPVKPRPAPNPVPKSAPKPVTKAEPVPRAQEPSSEGGHEAAAQPPAGAMPNAASGAARGSAAASGVRELSELGAVQRVRPDYPVMSRKRREEGTVTLLIALRDGSVSDVKIERSSGHAALDEAAVSAVRKWRFTAVGSLYARVPITFRLNGRGGI